MARPPPCAWPTPAARAWGVAPTDPAPPSAGWASAAALSPWVRASPPASPAAPSSRRRRLSRAGRQPESHQALPSNLHMRVLLLVRVHRRTQGLPLGAVILRDGGRYQAAVCSILA